jgi:redox-sensitive bicupin YhaK (pirin superfamily)
MTRYIDHKKMGRGRHGWLDSHFHFSFAEYYNPDNMNFGVLRVLNDDLVQPGTGFDTHPHRDMEIVSYVVEGELTHQDSMRNKRALTRGQVQYMSAGTGVLHSEYNLGDKMLRFLQIWILPDRAGYEPDYGDFRFEWADRIGRWMPVASGTDGSPAPVRVHSDINISAALIEKGGSLELRTGSGRQTYLVLIEGAATAGDIVLEARDALELVEEDVVLTASEDAHFIALEMAKGD